MTTTIRDNVPHDLTVYLQQETNELRALLKRSSEDIAVIGQRLILIRARLASGQSFYEWCSESLGLSRGTVENFMNTAIFLKKFPNFGRYDPSVIYELAAPSMPEEIIQAIGNGQVEPDVKIVKALKREYNEESRDSASARSSSRLTPQQLIANIVELVQKSELYVPDMDKEQVDETFRAIIRTLASVQDGKLFARNKGQKTRVGMCTLACALEAYFTPEDEA